MRIALQTATCQTGSSVLYTVGFMVQPLLDEKYSQHAVLASNFGGITGGLLSLDGGELAGRLKADALFPVAGYKRCLDTQNGYGEKVDSSSETA